jgi:hypothetical protein
MRLCFPGHGKVRLAWDGSPGRGSVSGQGLLAAMDGWPVALEDGTRDGPDETGIANRDLRRNARKTGAPASGSRHRGHQAAARGTKASDRRNSGASRDRRQRRPRRRRKRSLLPIAQSAGWRSAHSACLRLDAGHPLGRGGMAPLVMARNDHTACMSHPPRVRREQERPGASLARKITKTTVVCLIDHPHRYDLSQRQCNEVHSWAFAV